MVHQKQLENVGYFSYLGSMIKNDARCTHEIKSRIIMAKAAFNKQNLLYTRKKKISAGARLFHVDGQTALTKLIVDFRNFANTPNIRLRILLLYIGQDATMF
jgi:hypothetical protein